MRRAHLATAFALASSACIAHMPAEQASERNVDGISQDDEDAASSLPVRPFTCADSRSPMFAEQSELALRISGDFTRLNTATSEQDSSSDARITFADGSAETSATIKLRGNSRKACGFRPFFVKFAEKQKGNVFEKLGKSVKFTTHCGDRDGMPDILRADSLAEYEERLRLEHAIYQVLDQLGIPSLKTRLVQITYHDTATGLEERHLGMVREPEDETAERCGMVEREDDTEPSPVPLTTSAYGELLTTLVNEFVIQYDRKNEFPLEDWNAGLRYTAAYDFDLVGVIREEYRPNQSRTLDENLARFATFLRMNQSDALRDELTRILARADAMRAVPARVGVSEERRDHLSRWLDGFLGAMADVLACDKAPDACAVSDDHPNGLDDARPLEEGLTAMTLAPVDDVDTFSATLEAGTLYTFTSCMSFPCPLVTLLDDAGSPIARGDTLSHRPERTARFVLRTDLGDRLLAVEDGGLAFYRDDHVGDLTRATPLVAGMPIAGRWELQNVLDEDWFVFDARAGARLHVTADIDFGFARVAPRDTPELEQSLDLVPGDNDLSSLIGTEGSYVLKLSHTDVGSYEVTLEP